MHKTSAKLICLLVAILGTMQACGSDNNKILGEFLGGGTPTPQFMPTANTEIVFAGKVVNPKNGEWTNNRLVLVFLKSKEIARAVTSTTEYTGSLAAKNVDPNIPTVDISSCNMNPQQSGCDFSSIRMDRGLGISDGIFVLRIPNTYELNLGNIGLPAGEMPFVQINEGDEQNRIGVWIDPFNEGESQEFYIPTKNIRYILKVLPGDFSQLPLEIQQPGSIALTEGNRLIAVDPDMVEPTPESIIDNSKTSFSQTVEDIKEQTSEVFSYNNCIGSVDINHQITYTSIQEITDTTGGKFGIELPVTTLIKFVADIEKQYSIKNQEIKTNSITLTVPPGKNIEFSVFKQQTWISGVATLNVNDVDISKAYQFLKSEKIVYQEQELTCP
ncbi:hypothetical protein MASR2M66_29550 [Chloroflexota bacterium]